MNEGSHRRHNNQWGDPFTLGRLVQCAKRTAPSGDCFSMGAQSLMRERFPGGKIKNSSVGGHKPAQFIANLVGFSPRCTHHNNNPGGSGVVEHSGNGWRPRASGKCERTARGEFGERLCDSRILG